MMAWTPFSAEAVRLDTELRRLHKAGRTSEALNLIVKALEDARERGPSNLTYEQFIAQEQDDGAR